MQTKLSNGFGYGRVLVSVNGYSKCLYGLPGFTKYRLRNIVIIIISPKIYSCSKQVQGFLLSASKATNNEHTFNTHLEKRIMFMFIFECIPMILI